MWEEGDDRGHEIPKIRSEADLQEEEKKEVQLLYRGEASLRGWWRRALKPQNATGLLELEHQ